MEKRVAGWSLWAMAVLLQGSTGAWAAGLHIVGSFATPEIPFPLTSIAVDTDRGTLLLGGSDGSINEFTRTGFFLEPVVPAGLVDGIRSPCDRGLAYVPIPEPRIYSSGGTTLTGLFRYSRSGEYQDAFALRGYQSYQDSVSSHGAALAFSTCSRDTMVGSTLSPSPWSATSWVLGFSTAWTCPTRKGGK